MHARLKLWMIQATHLFLLVNQTKSQSTSMSEKLKYHLIGIVPSSTHKTLDGVAFGASFMEMWGLSSPRSSSVRSKSIHVDRETKILKLTFEFNFKTQLKTCSDIMEAAGWPANSFKNYHSTVHIDWVWHAPRWQVWNSNSRGCRILYSPHAASRPALDPEAAILLLFSRDIPQVHKVREHSNGPHSSTCSASWPWMGNNRRRLLCHPTSMFPEPAGWTMASLLSSIPATAWTQQHHPAIILQTVMRG